MTNSQELPLFFGFQQAGDQFGDPPETNPFASFGAKNTPSASPLPKVHDSTKKKLAQFGADTSPSKNSEDNEETRRYKHMDHPFLQPDKIMVILLATYQGYRNRKDIKFNFLVFFDFGP